MYGSGSGVPSSLLGMESSSSPNPLNRSSGISLSSSRLGCDSSGFVHRNPSRDSSPSLPGCGGSVSGSPMESSQIVQVPLVSQTIRRNRIIEVPEIHVVETVVPKIQVQEVIRTVPKVEVEWVEKLVEVPQVQIVDKTVEVPQIREVTRSVPKVEIKEIIHQVPKYEYQVVEKYVDVPEIKNVDRIVEVPQIQQIIKHVEKVEVVEVPIETVKHVPKIEIKTVEKIRHIPGPIEYVDVPVYKMVEKPIIQTIEKIIEVPEVQDVCVETPIMVPSKNGEFVDIPIEVPVYVDVPEYRKVPGRVIPVEKEKLYEKIVEVPVPVPQEHVKIVKVPVQVPVDVVKEVPVPEYVDEIVQVPHYVPVLAPPPIIQPVPQEEIVEGEPVYETAPARYVYDPPVYADPIIVNSAEPIYQDGMAATGNPNYPQTPRPRPLMPARQVSRASSARSTPTVQGRISSTNTIPVMYPPQPLPNFHMAPQMMHRQPHMGTPYAQFPRPMVPRPNTAYPLSMTPPMINARPPYSTPTNASRR